MLHYLRIYTVTKSIAVTCIHCKLYDAHRPHDDKQPLPSPAPDEPSGGKPEGGGIGRKSYNDGRGVWCGQGGSWLHCTVVRFANSCFLSTQDIDTWKRHKKNTFQLGTDSSRLT